MACFNFRKNVDFVELSQNHAAAAACAAAVAVAAADRALSLDQASASALTVLFAVESVVVFDDAVKVAVAKAASIDYAAAAHMDAETAQAASERAIDHSLKAASAINYTVAAAEHAAAVAAAAAATAAADRAAAAYSSILSYCF